MSFEDSINFGISIYIDPILTYDGADIEPIEGYAYSWPNSGTLMAVSIMSKNKGEVRVHDPFLYPGQSPMDAAVAKLLWDDARSAENTARMERAFDEAAERSRYGAETEAAMQRTG